MAVCAPAEPRNQAGAAIRLLGRGRVVPLRAKQRSCTAKAHKDQPGLPGNHGGAANETEARLAMVLPGTNMPRPTGGAPCPRVALGMGLRQTGVVALFPVRPVPRPCGIVAVCGMGLQPISGAEKLGEHCAPPDCVRLQHMEVLKL